MLKEIEIIDQINQKIYKIAPEEEIVFHPQNPDYPIVIKELFLKYNFDVDKKFEKITIVFELDGETMLLFQKEQIKKKNKHNSSHLVNKYKEIPNETYKECSSIGLVMIDKKPCVVLVDKNLIYYFKFSEVKGLIEFIGSINLFIKKQNL